MAISIYALQQEKGIKVGISTNWNKRKKSYQSQGNVMDIINVITTDDTGMDSSLKRIFKDLGLCVKIENQSSTEVYDIKRNGIIRLFEYISNGKKINQNIVDILLKGNNRIYTSIAISEFRNLFGTKYRVFEHQRSAKDLHIKSMCEYMQTKYHSHIYNMPPIIVANNGDNTYDILDGNHRTHAYLNIPENHPVLQEKMLLCVYQIPNTPMEKLSLFRSINKNLPMSEIHLNENFIIDVIAEIKNQLIKSFGKKHIHETERKVDSYDFISATDIDQFATRKNLLYLLESNIVKGLDASAYANMLCDLNHMIYEIIDAELGTNIFNTDISVLKQKISDEHWLDILMIYTTFINENKKLTMRTLKNKLDKIRIQYRKKINISKTTKIKKFRSRQEPFLLGLIYYKTPLMECNTRITNRYIDMAVDNDE